MCTTLQRGNYLKLLPHAEAGRKEAEAVRRAPARLQVAPARRRTPQAHIAGLRSLCTVTSHGKSAFGAAEHGCGAVSARAAPAAVQSDRSRPPASCSTTCAGIVRRTAVRQVSRVAASVPCERPPGAQRTAGCCARLPRPHSGGLWCGAPNPFLCLRPAALQPISIWRSPAWATSLQLCCQKQSISTGKLETSGRQLCGLNIPGRAARLGRCRAGRAPPPLASWLRCIGC